MARSFHGQETIAGAQGRPPAWLRLFVLILTMYGTLYNVHSHRGQVDEVQRVQTSRKVFIHFLVALC